MSKEKLSTTDKARVLRKQSTDVERLLWTYLRGRRFFNVKFKRQFVIDKYIVDFVSLDYNLVIELDGGQHMDAKTYDENRTDFLNKNGFKVLRFWNHDVLENLDGVLLTIKESL